MSEMEKKICLGCMQEINADDVMCPHCGFDPNNYRVNPRCLSLGTKLAGKYIIGKVIGEGGFGITYIGWDEKLELPIAIKEFFPPKIASRDTTTGNNTIYVFDGAEEKSFEDGMRRSVKEARSMSKLEAYEGIVSIRDFFNENKTAYIIMEYVDGDTLKKYFEQKGKMSAEDVLKVMKPIMKALEQMHRTGLIHRDVSPDNIMIRRDGQVKLIDFGSARVAREDDEKSLTIMLKRGFSPEEQYRSKGHQGAWTDIYALCATMYYMLTGKIPPEAMERLANDEYKSLKTYDDVNLTTDIIVGFPGETDEDFETTYNYLKKINFYKMHVFPYSPRKGTVAAKMSNQIQGDVKEKRSKKLIELSNENQKQYNQNLIGKDVEVLFEEKNKEGYYKGHTQNYILVEYKTDEELENKINSQDFEYEDVLGDIIISIDRVKEQAEEYGHSFEREFAYMIVHGFYHLMGYDHIKEEDKAIMRPKEEKVLNKLGITREDMNE